MFAIFSEESAINEKNENFSWLVQASYKAGVFRAEGRKLEGVFSRFVLTDEQKAVIDASFLKGYAAGLELLKKA